MHQHPSNETYQPQLQITREIWHIHRQSGEDFIHMSLERFMPRNDWMEYRLQH